MDNRQLSVRGRIFDIQKFSVHDGPGIRTIVFLKGCRLRCRWCCNPESQEHGIQKMVVNGEEKVIGRDVTVGEVLEEVRKDEPHYRRSGGGLTLSGGECLLQPEFSRALLQCAQECGINTAIESTGFASFTVIETLLPYIDTFLMDIKHMDAAKHRAYTGQPNDVILANAPKIAEKVQRLIIRVPVVPGFNDTPEEIRAIAQFAATLPRVQELHLLPYHRLGQDKYEGLGRTYTLPDILPPPAEQMERLLDEVKAAGLQGQIGG